MWREIYLNLAIPIFTIFNTFTLQLLFGRYSCFFFTQLNTKVPRPPGYSKIIRVVFIAELEKGVCSI